MDKAGCDHWFQTTERNGKWVTECEYCHEIRPEASTAEQSPEEKEFWDTLHELWGMWHDGVPYSQEIKDKWGRLLHRGKALERVGESPAPATTKICNKCGYVVSMEVQLCPNCERVAAPPEPATSAEAIAEKMVFRVFYDDEGEHKLCILNHLGHGGYICFETGDDDSEVDDVRHRIVEALKFYVAPLQAKLSTLEQALRKIDDLDVLIQAADYLRQAGGGPMEDRLRLLHENLTAMSGESRQ